MESRESAVTLAQWEPLELQVPPVHLVPSGPWANRATEESLVLKDPLDLPDLLGPEEWLDP